VRAVAARSVRAEGSAVLGLKARAERRSKKPRIRFVPSKVVMTTNLGRGLASSLKDMGRKVLPGIGQRVVVAEAWPRADGGRVRADRLRTTSSANWPRRWTSS